MTAVVIPPIYAGPLSLLQLFPTSSLLLLLLLPPLLRLMGGRSITCQAIWLTCLLLFLLSLLLQHVVHDNFLYVFLQILPHNLDIFNLPFSFLHPPQILLLLLLLLLLLRLMDCLSIACLATLPTRWLLFPLSLLLLLLQLEVGM